MLAALLVLAACSEDAPADGDAAAPDVGSPNVAAARSALDEVLEAMEARDLDTLAAITTGPARAFFAHARIGLSLEDEGYDAFPNLRWDVDDGIEDDGLVRFPGAVTYGDHGGAPPRVFSDLELADVDGRWRLVSFVRNDHPIAEWVAPAPPDPVHESGPITIEITGLFIDMGCFSGSDESCPPDAVDLVAVDFHVTNHSDGPLEPVLTPSPVDDAEGAAWLATADGTAHPLWDASLAGFPPDGRPSPVMGLFPAARQLANGGTLHIALATEEGSVHTFELPLPPYPHAWD